MSAVTEHARDAGKRVVIHDVDWESYQSFRELIGNRPVRLTYDRGTLELMTPLPIHERYKSLFVRLIEILADELDLDYFNFGSMTIPSRILECGLEPDACFHIASAGKVGDWKQFDPEAGPPPDLAVEIDVTSDSRRRLRIYAALQVAEVWRFDGERLSVLILRDGEYEPSETSASFPLAPMDAIAAFVRDYETGTDKTWSRAFRRWVRETIVPQIPDDREGDAT
jgi:Uma2 family endonuclease